MFSCLLCICGSGGHHAWQSGIESIVPKPGWASNTTAKALTSFASDIDWGLDLSFSHLIHTLGKAGIEPGREYGIFRLPIRAISANRAGFHIHCISQTISDLPDG
jgi:hypothetical protein